MTETICDECGWPLDSPSHPATDFPYHDEAGKCRCPGKCTCGHPYRYHLRLCIDERGTPSHPCDKCECLSFRYERRRGVADRRKPVGKSPTAFLQELLNESNVGRDGE